MRDINVFFYYANLYKRIKKQTDVFAHEIPVSVFDFRIINNKYKAIDIIKYNI